MKQVFIVIMLSAIFLGCRKEHSSDGVQPRTPYEIAFEVDGEKVDVVYNANEANEYSTYMFGGMAGNYFGVGCAFKISERASLSITFGTLLSSSTQLTEASLLQLLAPGERLYGSLGAYSSYPARDSNRVEIAYTDKQSRRWCSTGMKEKYTHNGVEASVQISQPQGKFSISKVEKVALSDGGAGYRVSGYFDCFLYEVNGHAKKRTKGDFTGVFAYRQ